MQALVFEFPFREVWLPWQGPLAVTSKQVQHAKPYRFIKSV